MEKDNSLNIKYPEFGAYVCFGCAIITFFTCNDVRIYLERLILPNIASGVLQTLAETAITMSFYVFLAIGALLMKSKYSLLQIMGMFLFGIGLGALSRFVLTIMGVLSPYRV